MMVKRTEYFIVSKNNFRVIKTIHVYNFTTGTHLADSSVTVYDYADKTFEQIRSYIEAFKPYEKKY